MREVIGVERRLGTEQAGSIAADFGSGDVAAGAPQGAGAECLPAPRHLLTAELLHPI